MSDFDKEAERRRLREKYEQDESRRQETARMSELLLKGATMTNKHCDDCGAPVFRYQEQEFCPNCQGGGSKAAATADAANGDAAESANSDAASAAVAEGRGDAADAPDAAASNGVGSDRRTEADDGATPAETGVETGQESAASPETDDTVTSTASSGHPRTSTRSSSSPSPPSSSVDTAPSGRAGTVTEAREALLRAVTTHATRGESADDPRRAREHLAAAREAAEALSALDR
ncbi:Sjogren's syndrome/scleroderma autoantigen 1 family protein [Halopelagius fulvigenes]|uniref:Sjogren's syndrome/scleroderma autoantigen 1 family protein n=1 Tax=Halopelagius fulvigenes TaxID=1198324 RepID=A0ABD5U2M4_9EURY